MKANMICRARREQKMRCAASWQMTKRAPNGHLLRGTWNKNAMRTLYANIVSVKMRRDTASEHLFQQKQTKRMASLHALFGWPKCRKHICRRCMKQCKVSQTQSNVAVAAKSNEVRPQRWGFHMHFRLWSLSLPDFRVEGLKATAGVTWPVIATAQTNSTACSRNPIISLVLVIALMLFSAIVFRIRVIMLQRTEFGNFLQKCLNEVLRRIICSFVVRWRPLASNIPSIRHKKRLTIWIVRCDCEWGINVTYMCNGYSVSDYILSSLCLYIF